MSELGKESENWHVWAGEAARSVGVENVFALGRLTRFAVESFGDGAYHFTDAKELVKALQPHLHDGVHILIKGSRCMALETIVSKLL
jgi:UDP-N-acetylmuramoyl-tripeptide--D-alanyl-D-alanine ligase